MVAIFDREHPVPVTRADHIFGVCGMTGQADAQTWVTLSAQVFAHPAHFFGCTGESVDEQATGLAGFAGEEEGFSAGDNEGHVNLSLVSWYQSKVLI